MSIDSSTRAARSITPRKLLETLEACAVASCGFVAGRKIKTRDCRRAHAAGYLTFTGYRVTGGRRSQAVWEITLEGRARLLSLRQELLMEAAE